MKFINLELREENSVEYFKFKFHIALMNFSLFLKIGFLRILESSSYIKVAQV